MNSKHGFLLLAVPALAVTQTAMVPKTQAEALLAAAAAFAKAEGVQMLLRETNQRQGRFHSREVGKPYLIIYDLTGKTLAHSSDSRHVGMDHSRVLGRLFEQAQRQPRGWYEPGHGAMDHDSVCYERMGNVLITVNLPPRS